MNLLTETVEKLQKNGKVPGDVLWVGTLDGTESSQWDAFALLANIEYDEGFGGNEIRMSLTVVGDGWWLERHEYDGSEWWEFKSLPAKQGSSAPLSRVKSELYD